MFISDANDTRSVSRHARRDPDSIGTTARGDRVLARCVGIGIGGLVLCGVLALRLAFALRAWPAGHDLLHAWLPIVF